MVVDELVDAVGGVPDGAPWEEPPVGGVPLGGVPVGGVPLGGVPVGGVPLGGVPVASVLDKLGVVVCVESVPGVVADWAAHPAETATIRMVRRTSRNFLTSSSPQLCVSLHLCAFKRRFVIRSAPLLRAPSGDLGRLVWGLCGKACRRASRRAAPGATDWSPLAKGSGLEGRRVECSGPRRLGRRACRCVRSCLWCSGRLRGAAGAERQGRDHQECTYGLLHKVISSCSKRLCAGWAPVGVVQEVCRLRTSQCEQDRLALRTIRHTLTVR